MPQDAIATYHALLDDQLAADASEELYARLRPRNLYFGDRPLCTVIRPHFYLLKDWQYLKQETEILLSAFAAAHSACLEDYSLREQLDLREYEEAIFGVDKGGPIPWTSSRLDSFFNVLERKLQFVEYNAETPAGMGYEDVLSEVFMELEPMKRFQKYYAVQSMPMQGKLLVALMRAYKEWGGEGIPQIGIIDWQNVPTLTEHRIIQEYFERHGVKTRLADPRNLEFRDGHLWAEDFRIDLIYKRVLASELIDEMGVDNPIIHAIKARAVMMTNSFSCKLLAKKASFALLSDEANSHLFDDAQLTAIRNHIPWTRRVKERTTQFHDVPVDLVPFASKYKERFVIKPNDEYGGKGVLLGWETPQSEWDARLQEGLSGESFVIQERVDLIVRDFPAYVNGRLDISPRYIDANPYVFYGHTVYGCLTRLSSVALLNVTAGGGSVVPTFLLQKKD